MKLTEQNGRQEKLHPNGTLLFKVSNKGTQDMDYSVGVRESEIVYMHLYPYTQIDGL